MELNQLSNGGVKLAPLPAEVDQVIKEFYADPIKLDCNQRAHDLRLTSLTKSEAAILGRIVWTFAPQRSLEIGLAIGASCVAIATARKHLGLNVRHVSLDPFQKTLSGSVGLYQIERLGLQDHVSWIPERSENYLSNSIANGQKYDFIFVDGGHGIGQTVTDAFYANLALNSHGVIAFHDCCLFSTAAAIRYLALECKYSLIDLPADSNFKRFGHRVRYSRNLGMWYSTQVLPRTHASLVVLQKHNAELQWNTAADDGNALSVAGTRHA